MDELKVGWREAMKANEGALALVMLGFRATGAKWIGEGVKSNSCLRTLSIGNNNIGADGAKWIGEALVLMEPSG
jgi:hypothetical protein